MNWYRQIFSIKNRIIFIGSQCVNKQTQDLVCQYEKLFRLQIPCQWQINMIKVLWCRFQQCLDTFTILLVEGCSETGLFRHLFIHLFRVRNFGNTKPVRVIFFFSKHSKFNLDFKNAAKNWEKVFVFERIPSELVSLNFLY